MLRPQRLKFETKMSNLAFDHMKIKRKARHALIWGLLALYFPYVSVKAFNLLDRLPIWEQRVWIIKLVIFYRLKGKEDQKWLLTGC